jgi:hypothetical protein
MCDPKTIRNVRKGAFKSTKIVRKSSLVSENLSRKKTLVKKMALKMTKNGRKFTSAKQISEAAPFECSATTVRRYLKDMEIVSRVRPRRPRQHDDDCERRFDFAVEQLSCISENKNRQYLFSDEKIFDTNDRGSRRMWVRRGDSPTPRFHQKWCPRVMVWGVIGKDFRKLIIFQESQKITSQFYVAKILPTIAKRVNSHPNEVFIQDGARPHTAKASMNFLREHNVDAPPWPARSPDLNVIENLWSLVERAIKNDRGTSAKSLARVVKKAWNSIPRRTVNAYVENFESRLVRCIELRGGYVQ